MDNSNLKLGTQELADTKLAFGESQNDTPAVMTPPQIRTDMDREREFIKLIKNNMGENEASEIAFDNVSSEIAHVKGRAMVRKLSVGNKYNKIRMGQITDDNLKLELWDRVKTLRAGNEASPGIKAIELLARMRGLLTESNVTVNQNFTWQQIITNAHKELKNRKPTIDIEGVKV